MLPNVKQLQDPAELARLMRVGKIGCRALAARVGCGKSTIERLRSGAQSATDAEVADAIEKEFGVEAGALFVVPDVPRAPVKCSRCGAARQVAA